MTIAIKKATADVTLYFMIRDTNGVAKTGLTYNTSGLKAYYTRPLAAAAIIALTTQTVTGAHADGGFVEVSAANAPGLYRLDLPDAVCATGVNSAVVHISGATGVLSEAKEIALVSYDPNDTVRLGLTALPNAAADAAGGLPISDAGGLNVDGLATQVTSDSILADTNELQTNQGAWATATGFSTHSAADVVTALGTGSGLTSLATAAALSTIADGIAAILADTGTDIPATLDAIGNYVAAIKAQTDNLPASPAATGDIPTASDNATAVMDSVVEGAVTVKQSLQLSNAGNAGKTTDMNTSNGAVRDLADSKNRIAATFDGEGNRTGMTLDFD